MEVSENVIKDFDGGLVGGHLTRQMIWPKIFGYFYYGSTHFKETWAYVEKYMTHQLSSKKDRKTSLLLQTMSIERPSSKLGVGIIL